MPATLGVAFLIRFLPLRDGSLRVFKHWCAFLNYSLFAELSLITERNLGNLTWRHFKDANALLELSERSLGGGMFAVSLRLLSHGLCRIGEVAVSHWYVAKVVLVRGSYTRVCLFSIRNKVLLVFHHIAGLMLQSEYIRGRLRRFFC